MFSIILRGSSVHGIAVFNHYTVVDCGDPPRLTNGRVATLSINTSFRSVAHYECDSGHYFEVGSTTSRICQENGEWSNEDIHCCEHYNNYVVQYYVCIPHPNTLSVCAKVCFLSER